MQFGPLQTQGIVQDKAAEGRRFFAAGVVLIAGSLPLLGLVVVFLGNRLGTATWVILAAMLMDLVLGIVFIVVGRRKIRAQQPGWEQAPPGWGQN